MSGDHVLVCDNIVRRFGGVVALKNVSVAVNRGEIFGLVGPNGSGKTTLVNAITGFYPPQEGRITLDGADIATVTQASLREAIAVVPQDAVLFNDTILYNVAFGRPGASRAEIEQAARQARELKWAAA